MIRPKTSTTWSLNSSRRQAQRAKLLADGRQALEYIAQGMTIAEITNALPSTSRARLYRAMACARRAHEEAATASSTLLGDPEPNPSTHWLLM